MVSFMVPFDGSCATATSPRPWAAWISSDFVGTYWATSVLTLSMYSFIPSTFESLTDRRTGPRCFFSSGGALVTVQVGFVPPAMYWQEEVDVDFTSPLYATAVVSIQV